MPHALAADFADRLDRISCAVPEGDTDAVSGLTHSLQGAAANLGATALAAA